MDEERDGEKTSVQATRTRKVSKLSVSSLIIAILGFLSIGVVKKIAPIAEKISGKETNIDAFAVCLIIFGISLLFGTIALLKIQKSRGEIYGRIILFIVLSVISFGTYQIVDFTYLYKLRDTLPTIPMSFNGASDQLKSTIVTARLDEVIPENSNVIWCSSFQFAWNELENNIIKEPIEVVGAQDFADYLNQATQTTDDIAAKNVFAVAGFVREGIIDIIHGNLSKKFPDKEPPTFGDVSDDDIIAYSYLHANVPFTLPYRENDQAFIFRDAMGNEAIVSSFGLYSFSSFNDRRIRNQVEILYEHVDRNDPDSAEFAVDLCKFSNPYQIVAAHISPKRTLQETIEYLEYQISEYSQKYDSDKFLSSQTLLIPNMFWNIQHHYAELEQKHLGNARFTEYFIKNALQDIQFRLDRNGAELKSEATLVASACKSISNYHFDCPFLILIKKRDINKPFFCMWVANAELLSPYENVTEK